MNALANLIDQDMEYARSTHAAADTASDAATVDFEPSHRNANWKREVISLDARRGKSAWEREVLSVICRYTELPQGWDSYNGKPLRLDTGMFALQVLSSVMTEGTPVPSMVPVSSGGVQIEWHRNGLDIELYIAAPFDGELSIFDHRAANVPPTVTPFKSDLSVLREQVGRLVAFNRHLAPQAHAG